MPQNQVSIKVFNSPAEAPNYREHTEACDVVCFNVVRKGTEEGRSTVDVVVRDEAGRLYATMLTGRLIRGLADIIGDEG